MSKILQSLCFSLILMISMTAAADQANNLIEDDATKTEIRKPESVPFYDGRKQGWFNYLQEPEEPQKKDPKEKDRYPKLSDYTINDLYNMYPDDFNELQTLFLKKAVQDPSEQNVVDYMTLQDIARKKALAFANVETMMSQAHPELTTSSKYPITTPGQTALVNMRMAEEDKAIRENRDDFALIIFTEQGCGFCEAQKSILSFFVDKYGWPVRDVDIQKNPNLAARFNITTTPTMLIVSKQSEKYMPVSVGVIALNDLEDRLFRSIRYMKGEITPEQWFMYNFEKGTNEDASHVSK